MSFERSVHPIKLGYLSDMTFAPGYDREALFQAMRLVFEDGLAKGEIDRPVEIVYREVEGLPKGSVKAVIDAFAELVDEGCLAVIGPSISDNAPSVRAAIEERFRVPALTMCGLEEWMGPWTFSLPLGSMSDEPRAWARLVAKGGGRSVGVVVEQSLIGETYLRNFRTACRSEGLRIVAEQAISQVAQDVGEAVERLHAARADAIVHCGFGLGLLHINPALRALDWDPPRYTGTAWQMAFATPALWKGLEGWVGLDLFDESNPVGQVFLDRYEAAYGTRPTTYSPLARRDLATIILHAFADARPLSPQGVRDALERVKLLPAACGAPGTRISFGNWMHRGWVGDRFMVARRLETDGRTHNLVDNAIFG